MQNAMLKVLTF